MREPIQRTKKWSGTPIKSAYAAMSGETARLIKLAKGVNPEPPAREMDVLLATGEQVTIALRFLQKLHEEGV